MAGLWSGARELARKLAILGMVAIFGIGVVLRYSGHPQSRTDEVVTILAACVVFFASAFVLPWREFIAFDMVFRILPPRWQRRTMVAGCFGFVAVFVGATVVRLPIALAIFPAGMVYFLATGQDPGLLGGIWSGLFSPTESAAVAAFWGIILGVVIMRSLRLRQLPVAFEVSMRQMA